MTTAISKDTAAAHKLIPTANAHYREFCKSSGDAIHNAIQIGEILVKVKAALPHGEFTSAVETRCDFTLRWGQLCMKAAAGKDVIAKLEHKPTSVDECVKAITATKPAKPPRKKKKTKSTSLLDESKTQSTSQSDAPAATGSDDDPGLNAHVQAEQPAAPVKQHKDTFNPAEFDKPKNGSPKPAWDEKRVDQLFGPYIRGIDDFCAKVCALIDDKRELVGGDSKLYGRATSAAKEACRQCHTAVNTALVALRGAK